MTTLQIIALIIIVGSLAGWLWAALHVSARESQREEDEHGWRRS